jgi:hypothetical protein
MPEQPIIGPTGTQIYSDGKNTVVRYRSRELVQIAYLDVRLDAAGFRDFITQSRINQASRLFGLNYHITHQGGDWVVSTPEIPISSGMECTSNAASAPTMRLSRMKQT